MGDLATRVADLIDRFHGGSVNAAARDTGVSQPTLSRIAAGTVRRPRRSALERIASFYGVSLDWLETGEEAASGSVDAAAPERWEESREWLRWAATIRRAELPPRVERSVLAWPTTIARTSEGVVRTIVGDSPAQGSSDGPPAAVHEAVRLQCEAWTVVVSAWLDTFEREAVARAIVRIAGTRGRAPQS